MGRGTLVLIFMLSIAVIFSCGGSDDKIVGPPPSKYKDLSERDHVLVNLELSYNERNTDRYDELLDRGFIFYFSPIDVREGNVSAELWDRPSEIGSARNMFDPNYTGPREPVSDIDLSLTYASGDDRWIPVTPEDQEKYPGETWYVKTVRYTLTVTSGETWYGGENIQASFVVRWADVGGRTIWRIVEWHDDTEGPTSRRLVKTVDLGSATQDSTWGKVKSLYAK